MKTIKTAEATDLQLRWLVAVIEGAPAWSIKIEKQRNLNTGKWEAYTLSQWMTKDKTSYATGAFQYTDWAQGGPIIEREGISLSSSLTFRPDWWATTGDPNDEESLGEIGPTPLIAAMRCYVASTLGETAEVPEELV